MWRGRCGGERWSSTGEKMKFDWDRVWIFWSCWWGVCFGLLVFVISSLGWRMGFMVQ